MRLIAFGCSLTFGHWLPDNADGNIFHPSKFAWPSILGEKLGIPVINKGIPGSSNKIILKDILDFDFNKDDQVFILWSHLERYTIFYKDTIMGIAPYKNTKPSNVYYKYLHNEYDHIIDFYTRSNHAHLLLESLKIKNYHLTTRPVPLEPPRWNKVNYLKTNLETDIRRNYKDKDFALDNQHPGVKSNAYFADLIYKEITG